MVDTNGSVDGLDGSDQPSVPDSLQGQSHTMTKCPVK
jgi:hypothetical protein